MPLITPGVVQPSLFSLPPRPTLFVETCAGTAGLSVCLHGGHKAQPTMSRTGTKWGYAPAILELLGLFPGQGADSYAWCEPDPLAQTLLRAYVDNAYQSAAKILATWGADPAESPELWHRLRAEGPFEFHPGRPVDPREVARAHLLGAWSYRSGHPESGFNAKSVAIRPSTATDHGSQGRTAAKEARKVASRILLGWPAVRVYADAAELEPVGGPGRVCVHIDPTYEGTSAYRHNLLRAPALDLARRWAAAGAVVGFSEAVPLAEALGPAWRAHDITGKRRGQSRRYSKQQAEWLTVFRPG